MLGRSTVLAATALAGVTLLVATACSGTGGMMNASQGGKTHALTVARKNDDGTYEVLGSVWDIGLGQSKDLTLDLSPGNYELQCNVVEEMGAKTVSHYTQGMHASFTVTA